MFVTFGLDLHSDDAAVSCLPVQELLKTKIKYIHSKLQFSVCKEAKSF